MSRPKRTTPKTIRRAAELRCKQTPTEAKLWSQLQTHQLAGIGFRRQLGIGPFIIELDGSQHLDQAEYDAERAAYLESKGYRVIRFWNNLVENDIEAVLLTIHLAITEQGE